MAKLIRFKITNPIREVTGCYVCVTDLARNVLLAGNILDWDADGNAVLSLGDKGTVGVNVLVYGDLYDGSNKDNFMSFSGTAVVEDDGAESGGPTTDTMELVMAAGQSLVIGTTNGRINPMPPQPELDDRYMTFNGTGSVGLERTAITDQLTSSLVPYKEGSTHASSFYTHGTTFLKSAFNDTKRLLWVNAGIGGEDIESLDKGGDSPAYANQSKYLERAVGAQPNLKVSAITFFHGSSDAGSPRKEYFDRQVTYLDNQQALIKEHIPNHPDVPVVFYQKGGNRRGLTIQQAQLDYMKAFPSSKCVGGTYWLNRQHPNTENGVNGAAGTDRVHLSVDGYRYLGDMAGLALKTDGYKPVHVTDVTMLNSRELKLTVHVPFDGELVVDTEGYNTPEFSGYGIELQRANGDLVIPTLVTVSSKEINIVFNEDLLPGGRIRIGYTPDDIGADFDTPSGDYPNTLTGTNIRSNRPHKSSVGLPDFYEWLCCDILPIKSDLSGMPEFTLGDECWRDNSNVGVVGYGQNFRWDGSNLTRFIDGEDQVSLTSTYVLGTSNPEINPAIEQGKEYQFSCTLNLVSDDWVIVYIGGWAKVRLTKADNGNYSTVITAGGDHKIEMRVETTDIVGSMDQISIRELGTATVDYNGFILKDDSNFNGKLTDA